MALNLRAILNLQKNGTGNVEELLEDPPAPAASAFGRLVDTATFLMFVPVVGLTIAVVSLINSLGLRGLKPSGKIINSAEVPMESSAMRASLGKAPADFKTVLNPDGDTDGPAPLLAGQV